MVNNSTNIIKTESLNSDGQQFHQYHQNEQSPLEFQLSRGEGWNLKKTVYPAPFRAGLKTG
jgi:hypothetical protein